MNLSPAQVIRLALDAGFTPRQAIEITAIAHAESGFNPVAIGDVALENDVWGPSVGLWQIRTIKAQTGQGTSRDIQALRDLLFQAKSAYVISAQGTNFRPWSTYQNGAYLQYVPEAAQALAALSTGAQHMANTPTTIFAFVPTPTGKGYWVVFTDGSVFTYGDAEFHGHPTLDANGVWQA